MLSLAKLTASIMKCLLKLFRFDSNFLRDGFSIEFTIQDIVFIFIVTYISKGITCYYYGLYFVHTSGTYDYGNTGQGKTT